jgi:hypothetical protein
VGKIKQKTAKYQSFWSVLKEEGGNPDEQPSRSAERQNNRRHLESFYIRSPKSELSLYRVF